MQIRSRNQAGICLLTGIMKSDAIYEGIKDEVKEHPAVVLTYEEAVKIMIILNKCREVTFCSECKYSGQQEDFCLKGRDGDDYCSWGEPTQT